MSSNVVRFVPAIMLGAGCLLISGLREQKRVPPRAPMASIAIDVPGYSTRDQVVPPNEQRIAGMSDYVLRVFQRDSIDGFSIYVGYYDYQVQGKTIHSPKNCLPGAGWEQLSSSTRFVNADGREARVNRFLLANKGLQAIVYYWYQGRGRLESSEYVVKWNLLRDAAVYARTEEALVRVVVPIDTRGADPATLAARYAAADSLVDNLTRTLIPKVERVLPTPPSA